VRDISFSFRGAKLRQQLIRRRTFRTKIALADRRFRIAFDRNQFALLMKNQLAATNPAVRQMDRATCASSIRACIARVFSDIGLETSAVFAFENLPDEAAISTATRSGTSFG